MTWIIFNWESGIQCVTSAGNDIQFVNITTFWPRFLLIVAKHCCLNGTTQVTSSERYIFISLRWIDFPRSWNIIKKSKVFSSSNWNSLSYLVFLLICVNFFLLPQFPSKCYRTLLKFEGSESYFSNQARSTQRDIRLFVNKNHIF